MRVRYLLPAMGALAITPAFAADGVGYTLNGWSDNILTISKVNKPDAGSVTPDPIGTTVGFQSQAVIKVGWNVGSDVAGNISLYTDNVGSGATLNVRQAYASWAVNKEVTLTMGKTYRTLGWIANEAPALYTINTSLIGYDSLYGTDPIGLQIGYAPAGSAVSGSFSIVNGLFTAEDGTNITPASFQGETAPKVAGQENADLGFVLEVKYAVEKKAKLNLELAYDLSSGGTGGPVAKGGNVFQLGVNGEYLGVENLVLAGEVIYRMVGEGETAGGSKVDDSGYKTYGLMGLLNYTLPKIGGTVPASTTLQVQYWNAKEDASGAKAETALGAQASLMTNPTATSNFGWNFEIGLTSYKDEDTSPDTIRDVVASTEMIVVF